MSNADSPERIPFSFRCPQSLYRRIENHAAALQMNVSTFVCCALQHALGSPEELEKALAAFESGHHPDTSS